MATHSTFSSAFAALNRRVAQAQKELPNALATEGTRFFVGNFDKEAFDADKWKVPQRRIPGTNAYKYPKRRDQGRRTRKTLVKSGRLKRAVNSSVSEKTPRRIVWRIPYSSVPYAAAHNYGKGRQPQRRFIGDSPVLRRLMKNKTIQVYKKYFR